MTSTAIGRQTTPFTIRPAATAKNAIRAVDLRVVLVGAPFPYVPEHIVEPPGVGAFTAHRLGASARVLGKPSDVLELAISRTTSSRAAGIFPLCLIRKAISVGIGDQIGSFVIIMDDIG